MRTGIVLALICSFASSTTAQAIDSQKQAVVFLFGTLHPRNPDNTPKLDEHNKPISVYGPLGTGFFVSYSDKRLPDNSTFVYLVTAKHVLRDADKTFLKSVDVRANLKSPDGSIKITLFKDIQVQDDQRQLVWFHSPTESDESVAIPVTLRPQECTCTAIPIDMFVDETNLKSDEIKEGDNLYFIGLMAQFYGERTNSPVVRHGTLAMLTDELVPTESGPANLFIAELQSWPGNSGSPVFLNLGGLRNNSIVIGERLRFLGILQGVFNNITTWEVTNTSRAFGGDGLPVGVSIIVPAMNLRKILDAKEAQAGRDAAILALKKPQ